jgi:Glu-tRNA(Gln) amidotransferase subunit E-like FAD-binding protein
LYEKVINLSSTQFSEGELELLSKGLQYNLSYNNINQWLENLLIETEVAISKLPINHQEGLRYLAKQNIEKIVNRQYQKNAKSVTEHKILKSIKQNLKDNNRTITCADKGKTFVIIKN